MGGFKGESKYYHEKHCAQNKAREREKKRIADSNESSCEHAETDENHDSSEETGAGSRFGFERAVPEEAPTKSQSTPDHEKRNTNAVAAKAQLERAPASWTEREVKWKKLRAKNESSWEQNGKKVGAREHLWVVTMKVLLDYLIQESGQEH